MNASDEPDADADPWFRPVWDDAPDETHEPLARTLGTPAQHVHADAASVSLLGALLVPLCAAQDALTRLDARTEAAPGPVRAGIQARLAFREAAGLLAAHHAWVHPRDLALRALDLTGHYDAAVHAGAPATVLPNTLAGTHTGWADPAALPTLILQEAAVPAALHLARLLHHLPRQHDPLADPATAAALLAPLGASAAADFDPVRFARWRQHLPPMSSRAHRRKGATASPPLPPLLAAAAAARSWMEAGITDQPTAAQALAVAALRLARADTPRVIPLLVWSAWPAIGQPTPEGLPRLRAGVAARLSGGDGESWEGCFLHLLAEGARAGLRELDRLSQAATRGAAVTAGLDRRARLGDALEAALRVPALTPKSLARQLHITHQAATRLLGRLAEAGVVMEVTGRRSFRAFAAG